MTRRLLAALALAAAVTLVLRLAFPPPPPVGAVVLAAAQDLPAGHVLSDTDLRERRWPGPDAPPAPPTRDQLVGRPLSSPVAAGDPVTPRQLLGPALLRGQDPDTLAVPLGGVDPLVMAAVRVGDRVQVWAGDTRVSAAAVVLALPAGGGEPAALALSSAGGGPGAGRSILVSLRPAELQALHRARAANPDPAPLQVVLVGR
ncbi:SAF domain-containing protein [Arsenicicoccus sp. oral taxon 190]|uniref:SAF domain-containing protein n=1 Tax=Arsenicicoccus sp. oral taxon 190 TaxID=1658671 RepID=UPI00067AB922|nr:SAF domain-containing protein [Arsenicicoccus sp. oral taxon 190]